MPSKKSTSYGSAGNKKGRWTAEEREYIDRYINHKPLEQIALELKRPLEAIVKYKNSQYGKVTVKDIKESLRTTPEWDQLTKEFFEDELEIFEHRYAETIAQFAEDILATERTQIFQMIKYEIMMGRNMEEKKMAMQNLRNLQLDLGKLRKTGHTQDDRIMITALEEQSRSIDIAMGAKANEYVKLQQQHESILKNLKATRDQRIKNVEARRKSWVDIIKALEDKEFREKEGAELALMQKAITKEAKRLSEYHQYSLDLVDKPILNHETVDDIRVIEVKESEAEGPESEKSNLISGPPTDPNPIDIPLNLTGNDDAELQWPRICQVAQRDI